MENTQQELKIALFKLAFFEPNITDENNFHILDYLILDCLEAYSPMYDCGLNEILKYIKTTFSVEFAEAEILNGGKRLEQKELVIINEPNSKTEIQRIKLLKPHDSDNQKKIKELEEVVFKEWAESLKEKYKSYINDNNIEKIIEIFQSFLTKMLIRHGKESVATIYPDNPKTQEWIDKIQNEIIKDLPKLGSELDLILQIEIPSFFKSKSIERRKYINNLFNASFLWHIIQIDESCSEYFKETTKGQMLILDNNILFSLIGLDGPQLLAAIHNLLKYANELEYKLVVTTKTLDEFYESIQNKSEKAYGYSRYSKDIAKVAVSILDSSNFIVSYLSEFVKNGLSIEEFAIEKSHIKNVLDAFNISITSEFREEIESSEELLDEESILRDSCGGSFSQSIIEHDAFHRILIKKIREDYKYKYSEAKAWFLTHDSKLPVYAHYALKGRRALPFCISINEWMQINRPFLKRTQNSEEFENSFQLLVTQPFLRSALSNFKVDKVREKLLSKLNRYQNIGSQLAFDLVTDVHFIHTLSKQTSDEKIEEKIEEAIVHINNNLKEENKEIYTLLEIQETESKEKIETLNSNLKSIKLELIKKDESHLSLVGEMKKLQHSIDEMNKKVDGKESEVNKSKIELEIKNQEIERISSKVKKQKTIIYWGIFTILSIFVTVIIWIFEKLIDWQWLGFS